MPIDTEVEVTLGDDPRRYVQRLFFVRHSCFPWCRQTSHARASPAHCPFGPAVRSTVQHGTARYYRALDASPPVHSLLLHTTEQPPRLSVEPPRRPILHADHTLVALIHPRFSSHTRRSQSLLFLIPPFGFTTRTSAPVDHSCARTHTDLPWAALHLEFPSRET